MPSPGTASPRRLRPIPPATPRSDGHDSLEDPDKTGENRGIIKYCLHDVMQNKAPEQAASCFGGDRHIQHNTGIADRLSGLAAALDALAEQGIR